jgi:hypothetical protein
MLIEVTLSYTTALILLFVCVSITSGVGKITDVIARRLIIGVGVVPGVVGVIYGFLLAFTSGNSKISLGVISAWLLLEIGAIQLKNIINKIQSNDQIKKDKRGP